VETIKGRKENDGQKTIEGHCEKWVTSLLHDFSSGGKKRKKDPSK